MLGMSRLLGCCCAQGGRHGRREAVPFTDRLPQTELTGGCQAVESRSPIVFRCAPFRREQAARLKAEERRVDGPRSVVSASPEICSIRRRMP
jgi:hypothetical protein